MNAVDQLCPNCGLCCDSTLFADVELRKDDDAKKLIGQGITLFQKTKFKVAFKQPCACFDGKLCKIYSDRPTRCRTFECGLLKKVQADEMTASVALKKIAKARKLAARVRQMLGQVGQRDEQAALMHRYAEAMSAPIDMAKDDSGLRGKLMMAVHDLMQMLQEDFLK